METDSFVFIFICIYLSPLILLMTYLLVCLIKRLRIKFDYSNTRFRCITGLIFMKYCKLPKDRDFFRRTLYDTDSILPTVLPKIDMNEYNFTDVPISNCVFSKNTILPKDPEFFQKIKNKEISNCTLPNGDYSFYNFKGVYLYSVVFPKKSKIPLTHSFFRDLGNPYVTRLSLPKSFKQTCHLYDLSKITLYTYKDLKLSEEQKTIIRLKNDGNLYPFIKDKSSKKTKNKGFSLRKRLFKKTKKETQVIT